MSVILRKLESSSHLVENLMSLLWGAFSEPLPPQNIGSNIGSLQLKSRALPLDSIFCFLCFLIFIPSTCCIDSSLRNWWKVTLCVRNKDIDCWRHGLIEWTVLSPSYLIHDVLRVHMVIYKVVNGGSYSFPSYIIMDWGKLEKWIPKVKDIDTSNNLSVKTKTMLSRNDTRRHWVWMAVVLVLTTLISKLQYLRFHNVAITHSMAPMLHEQHENDWSHMAYYIFFS